MNKKYAKESGNDESELAIFFFCSFATVERKLKNLDEKTKDQERKLYARIKSFVIFNVTQNA